MQKVVVYSISLALLFLPLISHAAPTNFRDFVGVIVSLINNSIVPLFFGIALVIFLWGVFRYFIADSSEAKERGRNLLVWGILALVVMVGVWGLVLIVTRTFFGQL